MKLTTTNNTFARIIAFSAMVMMVVGMFPLSAFAVQFPDDPSVSICHATNAHNNPYGSGSQSVNASSIVNLPNGHEDHDGPVWFDGIEVDWGDIIPPFTYDLGEGEQNFPGLNWNAAGQEIWGNNCQTPEPAPTTMIFDLEKKFSGPVPEGYTADQFSFKVEGISDPISLTAETDDFASAEVELGVGTYTIEEIGPEGFIVEDWTIQWSGPGCQNEGNSIGTVITIDESDLTKDNFGCRADNQWKPIIVDPESSIVIEKVTNVESNEEFDFSASWEGSNEEGEIDFSLENGEEEHSGVIAAGTYSVTEINIPENWELSSVVCTSNISDNNPVSDHTAISVSENEVVTCVFTNTFDDDNGGGGNGGDDDGSIEGYKWEDVDKNGEWETTEPGVPGWEIKLYQNETLEATTTTDENGKYWFTDLEPGVYGVCEEDKEGWFQTFPGDSNGGCYDVEVTKEALNHTDKNFGNKRDNDNPGGGGGNEDTFIIEGYVWHDDNENAIWEGFPEEQEEEASTTEESLVGWTVRITNGSSTFSTTTDSTGYYFFEVPAGTWTITQELEPGWKLITPVSGNFIVVAPALTAQSFTERVLAFIIPTAHAAVVDTLGPFNFGNNEDSSSTGGGDGSGGDTVNNGGGGGSSSGGGSSRPRCVLFEETGGTLSWETRNGRDLMITANGTEIFSTTDDSVIDEGTFVLGTSDSAPFELTVTRGSRSDTCVIEEGGGGRVLGDQVSVVPLGAANAGAGGAMPLPLSPTSSTMYILTVLFGNAVRVTKDGK